MRKSGPYDFPPKKPEKEGDQEGVTQPEQQPGEDLETADQGAGVPVQHQSSGSELMYRLFQPSHHAVQLAPLCPQLESASSFTPVQSVSSSPFKQSSPHYKRIPSVPNPYESPGRIPSGSSTQSFVPPPRDPSTQVPLSPSYRTPLSGLSTQSFASPPELTYRIFQPSQHHLSARLKQPSPNLESASSFTSAQSAPSSPFKRSSPHFTRSPSAPSFVLSSSHQSQSSTPSESMTQLSVSTQSDASAHVPLSSSYYRSPESYQSSESLRSSESHQSSQSSLPPECPTSSRPQQDYSFQQQSQAQSFHEPLQLSGQLQPLHSQQPQLQPYQDQPTLTQSQSYQQPQLYDQLPYFSTPEFAAADLPGATGTVASSPASQSDPQISMIEQFQIYRQPLALKSQQPQLQTYQPFQTHQQFQPYQQPKPHYQSQQPQQADLTRAGGTFASSASPQHHQRQYLPERASGQVASHTSPTKQGSMQNVLDSPSKKVQLYYRYQNQCNDCKECFKTPQDLKNHKTSVHKMKNCNIGNCRFETKDEQKLKSHQVQVHVGQLDIHNILVPVQGDARTDSPTSSDPAPSHSSSQQDNVGTSTIVKCNIDNCTTICTGERGLMVHRNLKHPEKTSRDCGFRARVEKVYYDHVIQNHANSVAAAEANAIRTNFPNPNPQPPVTTTAANSSQHNLPPAQGQPTNTGRNQCQVCGEQKTSKYLLGIHEKMHLEHKCESCTTFYKNAEELDWHKKSVFHTSGGNLIINCQQCHADFKTLPEFKAHCENFVMTPGKDKILLCPICGYPSGTMENLRGHYYRFGDEHYDDSNVRRRDRDDDSDRKSGGGGGRQQSATN